MKGAIATVRPKVTVRTIPWILAILGLAIPMIGSGFIGWPFAAFWLVLLLIIWWVRPLGGVDRFTRLALGIASIPILLIAGFEGGWYLLPAVIAWLAIEVLTPPGGEPGLQGGDEAAR